ncbi:MAG: hypothetical protein A2Y95_06045 [Deltaproteobacteria bacterium RBG_13_65_10]|nr:MAG: hypothetical protein A2Y95_06045 [Deltaproteobacteria bacterium RBG_13_65_10]
MSKDAKEISQKALKEFLSEAEEIIEKLNQDLLTLDRSDKRGRIDPETVNEIFRAAHSLKGLSGMFGISRMTTLSHNLENILDKLRLGKIQLSPRLLDLLFEAVELLNRIVEQTSNGEENADSNEVEHMIHRLDAAISQSGDETGGGALDVLHIEPEILGVLTEYEEHRLLENIRQRMRIYKVHARFDLVTFDHSLGELTTQLKVLGEVITTLPSANATKDTEIEFDILLGTNREERELRGEFARSNVAVNEVLYHQPSPGEAPAPMTAPVSAADTVDHLVDDQVGESIHAVGDHDAGEEGIGSLKSVSDTVRVDIRKLDHLMNLVGELGLIRSSVVRLGDRIKAEHGFVGYSIELHKINKVLERKLAELQESVMDVRMVPLRQVFDKLSRVVRKLSRETGKRAKLEVEGADTELDKLIIEELVDPLMHIVRNSIDHGIEPRADRVGMGKPEEGVIRIKAAQRGNHVVIEVTDDGGGMDPEVLREIAVEKGLLPATEQVSKREIFDMIFLPGFSTKKVVTEVSGRGVGMDVVKENISRLSGIVDVDSELGKGTRLTIVLPITLAIIQALIVESGGKPYAVPLNSVLECLTIHRDDVQKIERHEVLQLRDAILPLARLDRLFHPEQASEPPEKIFVVVVGLAEHRLGLVVDRLRGRQDIVIKSIGKSLQNIRGIAGATELGDQQTILVVDIGALIEESVRRRD